jgi:hypothetical protein
MPVRTWQSQCRGARLPGETPWRPALPNLLCSLYEGAVSRRSPSCGGRPVPGTIDFPVLPFLIGTVARRPPSCDESPVLGSIDFNCAAVEGW